ncbi:MAG: nitrite/sulfite reductase, partial [Candidatus Nitrosomaritimum yanchengensis]
TPNEIKRPIRVSDESGSTAVDGYARWLKGNTFKQKQQGYYSVFVTLEAGDITSNQLHVLSELIQDFSSEGLARAGFSQNISLRYVNEDDLPHLYTKLLSSGLAKCG